MIDLSTISKSYPFLSFARQRNLDYGDVLLLADIAWPSVTWPNATNDQMDAAARRVGYYNRRAIMHLVCAVVNGEIGHGE